jgi:CHAT domain-containing protein
MRRAAAVLLLLLTFTASAESLQDAAARIAPAFVAALQRDDIRAFDAITVGGNAGGYYWDPVQQLFERAHDIAVDEWDVRVDPRSDAPALILRTRGTSRANGGPRRVLPLTRAWWIRVQQEGELWNVIEVTTLDQKIARDVHNGCRTLHDALTDPDVDPATLLPTIAFEAPHFHGKGLAMARLSAAVARAYGETAAEAMALRYTSRADLMALELRAAIAPAAEALEIAQRTGDINLIAEARFGVAAAAWRNEQLATAVREYLAIERDIAALDDPSLALKGIYMAGSIERQRGRMRQGAALFQRLMEQSPVYGWHEGELAALAGIGNIALDLGQIEVALQHYRRNVQRAEELRQPRHAALARYNLALAHLELGELAAAESMVRSVITGPVDLPEAYVLLARVLVAQRRFDKAEEALQGNLRHAWPYNRAWALLILTGIRQHQQRWDDSIRLAEEAAALYHSEGGASPLFSPDEVWRTSLAIGRALHRLGRSEEGADALRDAVGEIETARASIPADAMTGSRFLDDKIDAYRALVEVLVETGAVDEALGVTEQMKARALQDVLRKGQIDLDAALTADERKRDQELRQNIVAINKKFRAAGAGGGETAALRRALDAARLELQAFETTTRLIHAERASSAGYDPECLSDYLPREDGLILDYLVLEQQTLLFVLRRDAGRVSVAVHVIPAGAAELAERAERIRFALAWRQSGWRAEASALQRLLLAPVGRELAAAKVICIVPDGPLWFVPFQLLGDLVEKAAVFYSPSLATLRGAVGRPPRPDSRPLLAVANPSLGTAERARVRSLYRDVVLGALPEAETEVRSIGRLYGPRSRVYTGAAASEQTAKQLAGEARVIHFATHGIIDDASPLYSALLLGPSGEDDGLLEAREVAELNIPADLAVLSACETARGRVGAGEGLIGLSWAFMAAGCPTTVVSHWNVASASTADLMLDFHRHLVRGHPPAEALRAAQLDMRRRPAHRHPFYWAAWVVVGRGW